MSLSAGEMPEPGSPGYRPGEVVRTIDGSQLGVVVQADWVDDGRSPRWWILVDTPRAGIVARRPEELIKANDAGSLSAAKQLGLRFPDPRRDGEFRPGDVVRSIDGKHFGVVLVVEEFDGMPIETELHVDQPDGGVGVWPAAGTLLSNDPESIAEAKRLGLRFPLSWSPEDALPQTWTT